jgi:hypothetical protein
MPQAIQWERLGMAMSLAVYVLRLCEVEQTGASASLGNHVLRLEENLGLTLAGMRMLRWQIGAEAQPLSKAVAGDVPAPAARAGRPSARDRLRVVPDGDI